MTHMSTCEMPVARWTTTVNKATENFTINDFNRISAPQVFQYIMETFLNGWELTLHYITFCWKIHNYYCQIKYSLHVSVQKLALSNFCKDSVYQDLSEGDSCNQVPRQSTSDWRCSTGTEQVKILPLKPVNIYLKMLKVPEIKYQLKYNMFWLPTQHTVNCRSPGNSQPVPRRVKCAFHRTLL